MNGRTDVALRHISLLLEITFAIVVSEASSPPLSLHQCYFTTIGLDFLLVESRLEQTMSTMLNRKGRECQVLISSENIMSEKPSSIHDLLLSL